MAGYFGKLPARADFVIGQCPKGFLRVWEPFLLKGLAQSRQDLGSHWKEAYMTMPVWRFDLETRGEDPAGSDRHRLAGAFMPSVDRVGREYPMTLVAEYQTGGGVSAEAWYDAAETVLLGALEEDAAFDRFQDAVTGLGSPDDDGGLELDGRIDLPAEEETAAVAASSFWCRAGQTGFAFKCGGMPEAGSFWRLLLPERPEEPANEGGSVGNNHGRFHPEDDRT